jgi:hypothetical protein
MVFSVWADSVVMLLTFTAMVRTGIWQCDFLMWLAKGRRTIFNGSRLGNLDEIKASKPRPCLLKLECTVLRLVRAVTSRSMIRKVASGKSLLDPRAV